MTNTKTGPIEVWLTRNNLAVTCRAVHEDESTDEYEVDSLSMRGAQREITGFLIRQGYNPVGRWSVQHDGGDGASETSRAFRPADAQS